MIQLTGSRRLTDKDYIRRMDDQTASRHSHEFSRLLAALRQAYEAANKASEFDEFDTHNALVEHIERLMADVENDDAIDSQGNKVSRRWLLEIEYQAVSASRVALRKSVITALYHLWERSVLRWVAWTGRKHASHSDLVGLAASTGASAVSLNRLEPLHFINNALKHDNPSWIQRLREGGYDRYLNDQTYSPYDSPLDPYEIIHLSHNNVIDFFDWVAACGPNFMQPWPGMLPTRQEFDPIYGS